MRSILRPRQSLISTGTHRLPWQHVIACAYAVIFGAVLPFICWGAWALPGHPHSRPHFVFLMPEIAPNAGTGEAPHAHHPAENAEASMQHGDRAQHANGGSPQGQSLPDLLLLLLALGMTLGIAGYTFRRRDEVRNLCQSLAIPQRVPIVPTPPPRPT